MEFRTKSSALKQQLRFYSNPGEAIEKTYDSRFAEDGTFEVFENGERNIQEFIESYRDSCDLNKMIARYMAGDPDALNKVQGAYLDVTDFPKTYAEMFNTVQKCSDRFEALDPQVKELFNNNPVEFYMSYGTDQFNDKINSVFGNRFSEEDKVDEQKSDE